MKETFFRIDSIKRQLIMNAAITEFASKNYQEASINQIIKESGISKGGLFKYIDSKDDLYLFVVKTVLTEFIAFQNKTIDETEPCYLKRLYQLAESTIDFQKLHPMKYQFILQVSLDFSSPKIQEVLAIRTPLMAHYVMALDAHVDWNLYIYEREFIKEHMALIMNGFNLMVLQIMKSNEDFLVLEGLIHNHLHHHFKIAGLGLRGGNV